MTIATIIDIECLIFKGYMLPFREMEGEPLGQHDISALFGNIQDILNFNRYFICNTFCYFFYAYICAMTGTHGIANVFY